MRRTVAADFLKGVKDGIPDSNRRSILIAAKPPPRLEGHLLVEVGLHLLERDRAISIAILTGVRLPV